MRAMTKRFGDEDFLAAWGHGWSCGHPEALVPLYAAGCRYVDVGSSVEVIGHDELRRFYRAMLKFAPDSEVRFLDGHGDGRGFAAEWIWSGTASGSIRLDGKVHPAPGAFFSVPGVAYCTLADDGTIASHKDYYDMRAVLQQAGLLTEGQPA
jgi:steroid delta-isomerase-like uncharacterized protein